MTDWTDGYRAALNDVERIATSRGLVQPGYRKLGQLLCELYQDAFVIEHEQGGRAEASLIALFGIRALGGVAAGEAA